MTGNKNYSQTIGEGIRHDPNEDDAPAHTELLRHIAEFDRWMSMTDRQREDEIRRAM